VEQNLGGAGRLASHVIKPGCCFPCPLRPPHLAWGRVTPVDLFEIRGGRNYDSFMGNRGGPRYRRRFSKQLLANVICQEPNCGGEGLHGEGQRAYARCAKARRGITPTVRLIGGPLFMNGASAPSAKSTGPWSSRSRPVGKCAGLTDDVVEDMYPSDPSKPSKIRTYAKKGVALLEKKN